jgi:hypothetical protein
MAISAIRSTAEILRFAQNDSRPAFFRNLPGQQSQQKGGLKWTFHEKTS